MFMARCREVLARETIGAVVRIVLTGHVIGRHDGLAVLARSTVGAHTSSSSKLASSTCDAVVKGVRSSGSALACREISVSTAHSFTTLVITRVRNGPCLASNEGIRKALYIPATQSVHIAEP